MARRVPRIIRISAMATSIVLCAAAIALWVTSHFIAFQIERHREQSISVLAVSKGSLMIDFETDAPEADDDDDDPKQGPPAKSPASWDFSKGQPYEMASTFRRGFPHGSVQFLGFGFGRKTWPGGGSTSILLPLPALTVLFGALPAVRVTRKFLLRRRRRNVKEGHCRSCGYDCRATPGKCPECGRIAPAVVRVGE